MFPERTPYLSVNGVQLNFETVDVSSILTHLRDDWRRALFLKSFGLGDADARRLLLSVSAHMNEAYRVDMNSPAVIYMNDLAEDRRYDGWPPSVMDFLRGGRGLRPVRKNLISVVFSVNPAGIESAEIIQRLVFYVRNMYPIRVGLVFDTRGAPHTGEGSVPLNERAVVLANAFCAFLTLSGRREAMDFMMEVC